MKKLQIGMSACLLGEKVRWNGGHELNTWATTKLGQHVDFLTVCPEVEMGLGVPRETVSLMKDPNDNQVRMIFNKSQKDTTELAQQTAHRLMAKFHDVDGFIFKSKSPSCGLKGVKIYNPKNGIPDQVGEGLFAAQFQRTYPFVPVIDDGRLQNPELKEHFLIHLYSLYRYKTEVFKIADLVSFHAQHKYLWMCFSPEKLNELGRIVAKYNKNDFEQIYLEYLTCLSQLFKIQMSRKRVVNALTHVYGYFKKDLNESEKKYILDMIESYGRKRLDKSPLLSLFQFLSLQKGMVYIQQQKLLVPYPMDL